jgi:hypothetical protein
MRNENDHFKVGLPREIEKLKNYSNGGNRYFLEPTSQFIIYAFSFLNPFFAPCFKSYGGS